MHYIQAKSILSKNNGMNLYRGCTHGCIYCDSRSDCYNMNHDFEDVEVKENGLKLLKQALLNKNQKSMIGLGSMSDPYIPLENSLKYTRGAMKIALRYGFGFTLITKSNLVLNDLDLLKKLNDKTRAIVQMTITTFDDDLSKKLEPNVVPTSKRFEVLQKLNKENIPTIVWLCPILPYINDTKENISNILDYCISSNVKGVICFAMGLTLREGNREYFYRKLDDVFPNLKEKYIQRFSNSYFLVSPHNHELMKLFHTKLEKQGIMHNNDEIFKFLDYFPSKSHQMTF